MIRAATQHGFGRRVPGVRQACLWLTSRPLCVGRPSPYVCVCVPLVNGFSFSCAGAALGVTGATVPVGIHPSKVQITKLKMNGNRQALLDRKNRDKSTDAKAKFSEAEVNDVD